MLPCAAILALLVGGWVQCTASTTPGHLTRNRTFAEQVTTLYVGIGKALQGRDLPTPRLSVTANTDYLLFEAVETVLYEREGTYHKMRAGLRRLPAITEAEAVAELNDSDIVLLSPPGPVRYPFDEAMGELLPRLQAHCDAHLDRVGQFPVGDGVVTVYCRPGRRIAGK